MIASHSIYYLMNTLKSGDREIMRESEKKILRREGLEPGKNLEIRDVNIGRGETIHVAVLGKPESPPMILLHGFSGAIVYMNRILKDLGNKFRVYAIDNPGTGLSSRVNARLETNDDAIRYYIERIEELRKALGLEKFLIAGHSLGAYISFFYTLNFEEHVQGLFLISPAGFRDDPNDLTQRLDSLSWGVRARIKTFLFFARRKFIPNDFIQISGPIAKWLVSSGIKFRLRMEGQEREDFAEYSYEMMKLPIYAERSVHLILRNGAYSGNPIGSHIEKIKTKTFIYYG